MQFRRYDNMAAFRSDVLDILLENEVQNNLLLSLITKSPARGPADWLLAAISDGGAGIVLTAVFIEPFNLLLYETGNTRRDGAAELLARELLRIGCIPPGVSGLGDPARRFVAAIAGAGSVSLYMSTSVMRLDKLNPYKKAPGRRRELETRDMFFAPYWERAFSEDCRSHVFSIPENIERLNTRLGKNTHFIWEDDGLPVSQAVHGRDTPNGAVINGVYTPPRFRGRGYATSVVAALTDELLKRGKRYCCLIADLDNPVSCGIYRKLGYRDVCRLEDFRFDISR